MHCCTTNNTYLIKIYAKISLNFYQFKTQCWVRTKKKPLAHLWYIYSRLIGETVMFDAWTFFIIEIKGKIIYYTLEKN